MRRIAAVSLALLIASAGVVTIAAPAYAADLVVTVAGDDPVTPVPGSLRAVVASAASGDVIRFSGVTRVDLEDALLVPVGLTIDGQGTVVIGRANVGSFPQLRLEPGVDDQDYVLRDLVIEGVTGGDGEAFYAAPGASLIRSLTLDGVEVRGQTADGNPLGFIGRVVDDVTITGSNFHDNTSRMFRGGLVVYGTGGAVVIVDTAFRDNGGSDNAAALVVDDSLGTVTLSSVVFERNTITMGVSSAVSIQDAAAVLIDDAGSTGRSLFAENTGGGAAVVVESVTSLTVRGTDWRDNTATSYDGAALTFQQAGPLTIAESEFRDNTSAGGGAALYGVSPVVAGSSITDTVFAGNTAISGAAANLEVYGDLTISRSAFIGNVSTGNGGALFMPNIGAGVAVTIESSSFSGQVTSGGLSPNGLSLRVGILSGELDVSNTTFDESASADGSVLAIGQVDAAGIARIAQSTILGPTPLRLGLHDSADPVVSGTILASSTSGPTLELTSGGGTARARVEHSLLSSALPPLALDGGGNIIATDPQLGPLGDHGGSPVLTRVPLAGSPAIDAGDAAFSAPPSLDGRAAVRVQNSRIDIGAVEAIPMMPPTGQLVSWWLLPVAGGNLVLGIVALLVAGRAGRARHAAR